MVVRNGAKELFGIFVEYLPEKAEEILGKMDRNAQKTLKKSMTREEKQNTKTKVKKKY